MEMVSRGVLSPSTGKYNKKDILISVEVFVKGATIPFGAMY
jgi:hypothetical protein